MANIYVGNLPFDVTEEQVNTLFTAHGEVDSVSLISDRDTGRMKGFGFVEMRDSAASNAAISALNGTDLNGRTITVNEARPKADRGGRSNDGGGRGDDRRW
jgi:RNA recognition motif-containing protein